VAEPDVVARAPISFEGADGVPKHAPLVAGRVGGIETLLVLDTGSEVHLLAKELVDEIGLAVEEGEEGVDHSGSTMPSWSVEDVGLELGGAALTLADVVAIPAPKPFPPAGIGGILSPQHLHPMLNPGGKRTEFSSAAVPGLGGDGSERLGAGVSGADVLGSTIGEATLVVSGRRLAVASLAVRPAMHDPQGLVRGRCGGSCRRRDAERREPRRRAAARSPQRPVPRRGPVAGGPAPC
jgi:hypothetical protein